MYGGDDARSEVQSAQSGVKRQIKMSSLVFRLNIIVPHVHIPLIRRQYQWQVAFAWGTAMAEAYDVVLNFVKLHQPLSLICSWFMLDVCECVICLIWAHKRNSSTQVGASMNESLNECSMPNHFVGFSIQRLHFILNEIIFQGWRKWCQIQGKHFHSRFFVFSLLPTSFFIRLTCYIFFLLLLLPTFGWIHPRATIS